ncbi:hypothetical protein [Syntrophus sp. (in: bacteria)]|uniref:hypothetical protein n=1 Tax=Syntrophus sp. (in: bacteria) TaxID=48412 RepID=UPI00345F0EC7
MEAVDRQTGRVIDEAKRRGLTVMVTADHGTVEKWLYPDGVIDTGHTDSPVPFILLHDTPDLELRRDGALTDIAPTVLQLFRLPVPAAMTGKSLIITPGPEGNQAGAEAPCSHSRRLGRKRPDLGQPHCPSRHADHGSPENDLSMDDPEGGGRSRRAS